MLSTTILVLFSVFLTTTAKHIKYPSPYGRCQGFNSQKELDLVKFSNKYWYEVERTENHLETNKRCTKMDHFFNGNNVAVKFDMIFINSNSGTLLNITGDFQQFGGIVNIKISFPLEPAPSPYVILETDYDNYAVIYNCYQASNSTKNERIWILSRYRILSQQYKDRVKQVLNANNLPTRGYISQDVSCQREHFNYVFEFELNPNALRRRF